MSNKLKLNDIWNLTVREETLTVLWGILTVLLLDSGNEIFYYMGWASGAWTFVCLIGILKSVWPKPGSREKVKIDEDSHLYKQLTMFLNLTFSNSEFIKGSKDKQAEIIQTAARRLYAFTKTYK